MFSCFGWGDSKTKDNVRNLLEVTHDDDDRAPPMLMEIVSAFGIESVWGDRVNPYCVVRLRKEAIHETKPIPHDPNPIWTVKTSAFCLLKIPDDASDDTTDDDDDEDDNRQNKNQRDEEEDKQRDEQDAVLVEVCHGNTCLGVVAVSFSELTKAEGERNEYPIRTSVDKSATSADNDCHKGTLALRFRRATREDLTFLMSLYQDHTTNADHNTTTTTSTTSVAADVHFKKVVQNSLFRRNKKAGKDHQVRHRVRPFPDPTRLDETTWMTRDEIHQEALKPSKKWIEAGSGTMGTVFLEIIGCDNLPNMDLGPNNTTDAFVGIVFEETMLRSNVVHDSLSPRWMPWSTRAFAISVRHPASLLMLGVFDYDEVSPLDNNDPIGRIVVNITNFESNTVYLLHYKLHHDAREDDSRGTIILRLRIQWKDEIQAYKQSLMLPPPFYINVNSAKALNVLRYITRGAVDLEEPSLNSVTMYAGELLGYGHKLFYFIDVMLNILLWRGRTNVSFCGNTMNIWCPIHSVGLFASAALALEFPEKIPAIVLYLIAWSLLAINYHGSLDPYPWDRCKSFYHTSVVLFLLGRSNPGNIRIEQNVGVLEAELLDTVDKLKAARVEAFLAETMRVALKLYSVYSKNSKNVDLATKEVHWTIFTMSPFSSLHLVLRMFCVYIRMFRNLINWKSYYANSFTVNCLILGTIWLLFPVETFALWCMRLSVWTFLGPWMKLVDVLWAHKHYRTYEELLANPVLLDPPNFDFILESDSVRNIGRVGRLYAEEALKLKDMREHLYGHYSKRVPSYDQSRYPSTPLPQSTAQPYRSADDEEPDMDEPAEVCYVDLPASEQEWQYVTDQKLEGTMIHVETSKSRRNVMVGLHGSS